MGGCGGFGGSGGGSGSVAAVLGPTGQQQVQGVAATPGWTVVGGIYVPEVPAISLFEAVFLVSQALLTGRVRLYDPVAAAAVAGSTLTSVSTTDDRQVSADIAAVLVANTYYQVEAECTGGALVTDIVVVRYALIREG